MSRTPGVLLLSLVLGAPAARAGEPPAPSEPTVGVAVGSIDDPSWRGDGAVAASAGMGPAFAEVGPVEWARIEPEPPGASGRAAYRWEDLDAAVLAWQRGAFSVVVRLSPRSPWAATSFDSSDWATSVRKVLTPAEATVVLRERTAATALKADAWRHWERFVEDAVERYDGDGVLDAPGLIRPVQSWQVHGRPYEASQWAGSVEEYLRLLHHADLGSHRAWEEVRIVHGGLATPGDPRESPALERLDAERKALLLGRSIEMSRLFAAFRCEGNVRPPGTEHLPAWTRIRVPPREIPWRLAEARALGFERITIETPLVVVESGGEGFRTPAWYAVRQWLSTAPPVGPARVLAVAGGKRVVFSASDDVPAVVVFWSDPGLRDARPIPVARGRYGFLPFAFTDEELRPRELDGSEGIVLAPAGSEGGYLLPMPEGGR